MINTIVLVEDEVMFHTLAKLAFKSEIRANELQLITYSNGKACLDAVESNEISIKDCLFFSDVTMPEMDGITMAKKLKELYPETAIVLFSSLSNEEYQKKVQTNLDIPFYPKPIEFSLMKELYTNYLENNHK